MNQRYKNMGSIIHASKVYTKEELRLLETIPDPCSIIIFGASGDLAFRKLFPSIFFLLEQGLMPKNFYVLGVARTPLSKEEFHGKLMASLPVDVSLDLKKEFIERCNYLSGDYGASQTYQDLNECLNSLDVKYGVGKKRVFYLSVPPFYIWNCYSEFGGGAANRFF
ncbi:MAG: hypothetical protein ACKVQC_10745 [Elusimicrobiota bacterium]